MQGNYNAKCPSCGYDFYTDDTSGETVCPSCGEKIQVARAKKYYSSIYDNKEEIKVAHGEEYHKVMLLLSEAEDLTENKDFEAAEQKVNEALSLTDGDYRVFMAMVAVKTKNYTDLTGKTHQEYLTKAIACADADGKKDITAKYKNYYVKSHFTDEEMSAYSAEELKAKKAKTESSFKSLIPTFMATEKRNKLLIILAPILMAIGIAVTVLFFFIDPQWLSFIGLVFVTSGYLVFRTWYVSKDIVKAFNSFLDLYDFLDGKDYNETVLIDIYTSMNKIAERFADRDPLVSINNDTLKLVSFILSLGDEPLTEFIKENKYFADNIPSEYYEEE